MVRQQHSGRTVDGVKGIENYQNARKQAASMFGGRETGDLFLEEGVEAGLVQGASCDGRGGDRVRVN